jgi:hypothetical protein
MQANPLWPVEKRFPSLQSDIRKDVLVVGGGMAGISSALRLKRAGFDVALIERDEVGGPAIGASSGVLYYGSGTNLVPAYGLFGEEKANKLWKETAGVIDEIVKTARDEAIDRGIRSCGSIMVAKNDDEVAEVEAESNALKKLGLPRRLLSSRDIKDYFPVTGFNGGLAHDAVGQVHPARFASGVARIEGLEIYEQTALIECKEKNGRVQVKTPGGVVRASDLVLATNIEPCFGMENHFELESSVILASEPTKESARCIPGRENLLEHGREVRPLLSEGGQVDSGALRARGRGQEAGLLLPWGRIQDWTAVGRSLVEAPGLDSHSREGL